MKVQFVVIPVLAILTCTIGCDQTIHTVAVPPEMSEEGKVAVIDLDRVARALGRDEVINQRYQQSVTRMAEQLQGLQSNLIEQITVEQEKLGEEATDEEKQGLNQFIRTADRKLKEARVRARNQEVKIRADLVSDFREEMQPVARRAAAKRGFSIVMLNQANLLYFDTAVDITDVVIDDLQSVTQAKQSPTSGAAKSDKNESKTSD